MHRVMLLNAKGGCGKTTIATNLAGYFAKEGRATVLIDHDGQGSSTSWLGRRPPQAAAIHGIAAFEDDPTVTRSFLLRLPVGTERVVVDTPANVGGKQLADLVARTDSIIIPVLASQIDIDAVARFLAALARLPRVRDGEVRVAVVANRSRENTVMFADLERFLTRSSFAFVTRLRESQAYIRATETGLSLHELRGAGTAKDAAQWAPLVAWVEQGATEISEPLGTAFATRPKRSRAGVQKKAAVKSLPAGPLAAGAGAARPRG